MKSIFNLFCILFLSQIFCDQLLAQQNKSFESLIIYNAKVTTQDSLNPTASAIEIKDGKIIKVGNDNQLLKKVRKGTKLINANGRRMIPGLNDNHLHVIRGGRFFNLELRWDGVKSLKQALNMLKEQSERTPEGQWIRVIGGWNEFQFEEKRLPTLEEINSAVPDKPLFILYLYGKALVNQVGLKYLNIDSKTNNPVGGLIDKDINGNPTGLLVAEPNAYILYSNIGKLPLLNKDETLNSTYQFLRELNRFGITSANDAGGGGQNFPDDYEVVKSLATINELTVRIPYFLFAQKPGKELDDYKKWIDKLDQDHKDEVVEYNKLIHEGAGENLVWSAADYENFLLPRPELPQLMENQLKEVLKVLIERRWPFRLHATYDESISRFLELFEAINKETPFNGLRWFFDHAETVSEKNLTRIKNLGGGIAIQDRMALQGEHFIKRYGIQAVNNTPPLKTIIQMGIPTGLGTDGTRVSTYNPWIALSWAITGKTIGNTKLYSSDKLISREQALMLFTIGSAWFSNEEHIKGKIKEGQYADIALLSDDFFTIPDDKIKEIESVLTIMNGKVVYASKEFSSLQENPIQAIPAWSPVNFYNGYGGLKK